MEVADNIVEGIDCPAKPVENYYFIALSLCLTKEFAFGPYGRPGDKRNIVPSPRYELAGYEGIFLRPAQDQPRYDMKNSQYSIHIKHSP